MKIFYKILCLIPVFGGLFIILTNQLEWYDKNKIYYHMWFIPSMIFLIIWLLYFYLT